MTRTLVFETPGLMDLRSVSLIGVTAKPNSANPIGQFGSGLKLSIAALCRLGTSPTIYVGRTRYDFGTVRDEFRGQDVEVIELRGPIDRREMPYTTGYGARWEPWMIYRELESNTIDEGGRTYVADDSGGTSGASLDLVTGRAGVTRIVVTSDVLVECHGRRSEVFLPDATRERGPSHTDPAVEVFDAPSRYLYYRGLRVYTLPRPARRTYNLLVTTELTEDRTLKSPWLAEMYLSEHIARSEDAKLVLDVLHATKDEYEAGITYHDSDVPSDTVVRVVRENAAMVVRSSLGQHVGSHVMRSQPRADPFAQWPRPWDVIGNAIYDANGTEILLASLVLTELYACRVGTMLDLVAAAVNRDAPETVAASEFFAGVDQESNILIAPDDDDDGIPF